MASALLSEPTLPILQLHPIYDSKLSWFGNRRILPQGIFTCSTSKCLAHAEHTGSTHRLLGNC